MVSSFHCNAVQHDYEGLPIDGQSRKTSGGTPIPLAPAPYNYNSAVFTDGVCQFRFQADGSVLDSAGNSISATFFFTPLDMNDRSGNLVRAVTLFGPSGSTRSWKYDPSNSTFISGTL